MGLLTKIALTYIKKRNKVTSNRIATIAAKALQYPERTTEKEIKMMAASLISQSEKD